MKPITVLVTGATGNQGGALARRLLAAGHHVRALTRDPNSARAGALRAAGAELFAGSFADGASIERAAAGVDTLFAMSTPFVAGEEAETREGLALVAAAKRAGVPYLVYASVANADRRTGIPHFESKLPVEDAVRASGLRWSIVAPVFFMDNLLSPWWLPGLQQGALMMTLPADRKLQQVPVEDLGAFYALVATQPERFAGRRIDLASDEISAAEVVKTISELSGRPIAYRQLPLEAVRQQNEDFAIMMEWFDRVGYSVDVASLRRDYPEVGWHSFTDWAKGQDWSALLQPVAG